MSAERFIAHTCATSDAVSRTGPVASTSVWPCEDTAIVCDMIRARPDAASTICIDEMHPPPLTPIATAGKDTEATASPINIVTPPPIVRRPRFMTIPSLSKLLLRMDNESSDLPRRSIGAGYTKASALELTKVHSLFGDDRRSV